SHSHTSSPQIYFFLFKSPTTTLIYPLSLHDALPIYVKTGKALADVVPRAQYPTGGGSLEWDETASGFYYTRYPQGSERPKEDAKDRKSTRLNSSHVARSYAVFCLKKKKSASFRCRSQ